jgi:hypothetical protein
MDEHSTAATKGKNPPHSHPYHFSVDGKPLESEAPILTGAQIKALAHVDPSFGLFLEGHGSDPNRQIADNESVDLRTPGLERFYTVPPATFGL